MKKKLVDIIILTYNRNDLLIKILEALKNQTIDNFNVIITDDGTRKLIDINQYPTIQKYIWNSDDGYHRVSRFNEGIKVSVSDEIILLDDDCIPQKKTFIEGHLQALREHDVSRGLIRFPNGGTANTWFSTTNLGIHRSKMESIGYFDMNYDGYYGFEDHDLGNTIKNRKLRIKEFEPNTEVLHIGNPYKNGDRSDNVMSHNRKVFVEKWGYDPTNRNNKRKK